MHTVAYQASFQKNNLTESLVFIDFSKPSNVFEDISKPSQILSQTFGTKVFQQILKLNIQFDGFQSFLKMQPSEKKGFPRFFEGRNLRAEQ